MSIAALIGTIVTILLGILGFMFRSAFMIVKDQLSEMVAELKKLNSAMVEYGARIKSLEEAKKDHEERLRAIEKR